MIICVHDSRWTFLSCFSNTLLTWLSYTGARGFYLNFFIIPVGRSNSFNSCLFQNVVSRKPSWSPSKDCLLGAQDNRLQVQSAEGKVNLIGLKTFLQPQENAKLIFVSLHGEPSRHNRRGVLLMENILSSMYYVSNFGRLKNTYLKSKRPFFSFVKFSLGLSCLAQEMHVNNPLVFNYTWLFYFGMVSLPVVESLSESFGLDTLLEMTQVLSLYNLLLH